MGQKVVEIKDKIFNFIKNLDKNKRNQYIALILVFFVAFGGILYFSTRTKYVVLARGLSDKRAAEMTAKLDEVAIPWKSQDNLTTLLVADNMVDKARITLSLSGITSGDDFGFEEIWSKLSFTQTTAEKNKLFLFEQQNSIAKSLQSLDAIDSARVILNVKESSAFLTLDEDVTTASVSLRLNPNRKLSKAEVNGIVNYVATAVRGLTPDKVTIIDQSGVQLNDPHSSSDAGYSSSKQNDIKDSIELKLNESLTDFLADIFGKGNIKIKTSVTLDFNSEKTSIVKFTPPVEGMTEGLQRSANVLKEKVAGNPATGAAGTDTNTTETPNFPTGDISAQEYNKSQELLNYELNEVNQTIEKAQGQITGVSIAVIINKSSVQDGQLSEKDRDGLIKLISSAAGIDVTKHVEVYVNDFFVEKSVPLGDPTPKLFNIPIWILALALIVIIVIVVVIVMSRSKKKKEIAQEVMQDIKAQELELEGIKTEFEDKSTPKYQIEKFIDERPDLAAQLLRTWMKSDT